MSEPYICVEHSKWTYWYTDLTGMPMKLPAVTVIHPDMQFVKKHHRVLVKHECLPKPVEMVVLWYGQKSLMHMAIGRLDVSEFGVHYHTDKQIEKIRQGLKKASHRKYNSYERKKKTLDEEALRKQRAWFMRNSYKIDQESVAFNVNHNDFPFQSESVASMNVISPLEAVTIFIDEGDDLVW